MLPDRSAAPQPHDGRTIAARLKAAKRELRSARRHARRPSPDPPCQANKQLTRLPNSPSASSPRSPTAAAVRLADWPTSRTASRTSDGDLGYRLSRHNALDPGQPRLQHRRHGGRDQRPRSPGLSRRSVVGTRRSRNDRSVSPRRYPHLKVTLRSLTAVLVGW